MFLYMYIFLLISCVLIILSFLSVFCRFFYIYFVWFWNICFAVPLTFIFVFSLTFFSFLLHVHTHKIKYFINFYFGHYYKYIRIILPRCKSIVYHMVVIILLIIINNLFPSLHPIFQIYSRWLLPLVETVVVGVMLLMFDMYVNPEEYVEPPTSFLDYLWM